VKPLRDNAHNKWSAAEDEALRELVIANAPVQFIASKLKRSVTAVIGRASVLRLSRKRMERQQQRR
jgi:hypothetical protein